ncbi:hypothetical protein CEXT_310631 [Caerostris extrusa]|uniref:Uncharacterized protein n=1 Tax=Caerostris extrusa TaxID=172846 RepID=A0AAV4U086_CAEEX|nr:hypothetical protein CEXT_310631 [Caerostris extrusa]
MQTNPVRKLCCYEIALWLPDVVERSPGEMIHGGWLITKTNSRPRAALNAFSSDDEKSSVMGSAEAREKGSCLSGHVLGESVEFMVGERGGKAMQTNPVRKLCCYELALWLPVLVGTMPGQMIDSGWLISSELVIDILFCILEVIVGCWWIYGSSETNSRLRAALNAFSGDDRKELRYGLQRRFALA